MKSYRITTSLLSVGYFRWLPLLLLFLVQPLLAQEDKGFSMLIDPEGPPLALHNMLVEGDSIVVAGTTRHPDSGKWGFYFARLDTFGKPGLVSTYFDPDGKNFAFERNYGFIRSKEGGYLLSGVMFGQNSAVLLKLHHNGTQEWLHEYIDTAASITRPNSIVGIEDGYLISGTKSHNFKRFAYVMKIDLAGNKLWQKKYDKMNDDLTSSDIQVINSNRFLISGGHSYNYTLPLSQSWFKSYFIHIDSTGGLVEEWSSGIDSLEMSVPATVPIDGGYIYCTHERHYNVFFKDFEFLPKFIKRDLDWNKVWEIKPTSILDTRNFISSIMPLQNGDLISVGSWFSQRPNSQTFYGGGCLTRITANGDILWSRCDSVTNFPNIKTDHELVSVGELSSGSIVAAGKVDHTINPGKSYGWLIKVDADGCMVDTLCTTSSLWDALYGKAILSVYPNPASERVSFHVEVPGSDAPLQIEVYDLSGRRIWISPQSPANTIDWDCSEVPNGLYFYRGKAGDRLLRGSFIVQR